MQQIADWLSKLGMSEYAQRFAENRIDFSVLPELTDQHLKDLGIALGDRLKILRAVRELADINLASPQPVLTESKSQDTTDCRQQAPILATAAPRSIEAAGERRHITVMFYDLVDSNSHCDATRCGGMARPGARLSRLGFGGGGGNGGQGRHEAR